MGLLIVSQRGVNALLSFGKNPLACIIGRAQNSIKLGTVLAVLSL